jgi:hypothetical protein
MKTTRKRKPGRPALPKNRYRGELITVRLQPGERAEFEKLARANKMSLSDWIRRALKETSGGELV